MVLLWERAVDWFYQSLPKSQSTHVVLQISLRCICLPTFLAEITRLSLQCCRAPSFDGWVVFTNALQSGDKRTPRREVGERQRSCSCTEHLARENLYIAGAGNVYNSLLVRRQVGVYWSLCTVVHCMMLPSLSCGFEQQQQWCCSKRNSWLVACLPICCTFDMKRTMWSSTKLM